MRRVGIRASALLFTRSAVWALFAVLACLASLPAEARAEIPAAEAYQLHCSGCHGNDGRGDARIVPSLREFAPLFEAPGGRDYLGRVPGVAQAPIASAGLATLLNFVLRELSGIDAFVPFTESEVERLRRAPLRDPIAMRPIPR